MTTFVLEVTGTSERDPIFYPVGGWTIDAMFDWFAIQAFAAELHQMISAEKS